MRAREQIITVDGATGQATPGHRDVVIAPTIACWRAASRALLRDEVAPDAVAWRERREDGVPVGGRAARGTGTLGRSTRIDDAPAPRAPQRVPGAFLRLASGVACHRDPSRWDVLYRVLWRLTHGEPTLLDSTTDPDVRQSIAMDQAVRRAVRRMLATVRFRADG